MSQVRTFVVKPDKLTNTLTIRLMGDGVSVPVEEVIHHLGSSEFSLRTRRRIRSIEQLNEEATLKILFREPFHGFEELDVCDAMSNFYTGRGFSCV